MNSEATLVSYVLPNRTLVRDIGLVIFGVLFTALSAQCSLPWQPVPFTLQTLAVTVCGLTYGARLAAATQASYVLAGAAGLPIFAEFSGGPAKLMGPTGGYLVAFILAAWLLGWATERGLTKNIWGLGLALIVANAVILAFGATWLSNYVPAGQAWNLGVAPFISGAFAKSVIAWAMLPAAWKLVKKSA